MKFGCFLMKYINITHLLLTLFTLIIPTSAAFPNNWSSTTSNWKCNPGTGIGQLTISCKLCKMYLYDVITEKTMNIMYGDIKLCCRENQELPAHIRTNGKITLWGHHVLIRVTSSGRHDDLSNRPSVFLFNSLCMAITKSHIDLFAKPIH